MRVRGGGAEGAPSSSPVCVSKGHARSLDTYMYIQSIIVINLV